MELLALFSKELRHVWLTPSEAEAIIVLVRAHIRQPEPDPNKVEKHG